MIPDGWPGHIWLEGRTKVHSMKEPSRPSLAYAKRAGSKNRRGFSQSGDGPARNRSVMLLADASEHNWIVPEGKRFALDALCATGVRPRRWRKEIPTKSA